MVIRRSRMKGAWKTVESIIAGVIILLFVAALGATQLQSSPQAPVQGYRVLDAIYEKGALRAYAADMNCSAVDTLVSDTGYMVGYGHNVQVCDEGGSCCGSVPSKENVWVSTLMIAGDEEYEPVEVILYVYRFEG
jgi:hypothetical protein